MTMRTVIVVCFCMSTLGCKKDPLPPAGEGNRYTVETEDVVNITQTTAVVHCTLNATYGGPSVTAKGIVVSTSPNPVLVNLNITSNTSAGSYTVSLSNLAPAQKYYARAFAVLERTVVIYGEEITFTTLPVALATVSTSSVNSITRNTALANGNVSATGGGTVTARGFCWSTGSNPTLGNSFSVNGAGTGSYAYNVTGLTANTTYYIRAYATNEAGTVYATVRSFTTKL
jgi:hypothetical protein